MGKATPAEAVDALFKAADRGVRFVREIADEKRPPSLPEVVELIQELVQAAEDLADSGPEKKALVLEGLNELDRRYGWRNLLRRQMKRLPGPIRIIAGGMLWRALEGALVDVVVSVLNAVGGWWVPVEHERSSGGETTGQVGLKREL